MSIVVNTHFPSLSNDRNIPSLNRIYKGIGPGPAYFACVGTFVGLSILTQIRIETSWREETERHDEMLTAREVTILFTLCAGMLMTGIILYPSEMIGVAYLLIIIIIIALGLPLVYIRRTPNLKKYVITKLGLPTNIVYPSFK